MTRRAVSMAALLVVVAGCSSISENIDRAAYYEARAVVAGRFVADPERPLPAVLSEPPGVPVTDLDSVARAIVDLAGQPAHGVTWTAARFLARQVADPERMCGAVDGDLILDLMAPAVAEQWRTEILDEEGGPYTIFEDCDRSGLPLEFAEMRVLAATMLTRPPLRGDARIGVSADVDIAYLVRGVDGVTPVMQSRDVFLYVRPEAPFLVGGLETLQWTTGPGFGPAGRPDPEAYAPAGDVVAFGPVDPAAPAAATVVQALAGTLGGSSVPVDVRREVDRPGDSADEQPLTARGAVHPSAAARNWRTTTTSCC